MIVLQLILFCAMFTLMVKLAVRDDALNALFFYPKPVQERVYQLGLTAREAVARKRKLFMVSFFLVMLVALLLIRLEAALQFRGLERNPYLLAGLRPGIAVPGGHELV